MTLLCCVSHWIVGACSSVCVCVLKSVEVCALNNLLFVWIPQHEVCTLILLYSNKTSYLWRYLHIDQLTNRTATLAHSISNMSHIVNNILQWWMSVWDMSIFIHLQDLLYLVIDGEPMPGTLDMKQEHTLDDTKVHLRVAVHTLGQLHAQLINLPACFFGNPQAHEKNMHNSTQTITSGCSGLNWEPWSCEAAKPHTVLP